MELELNIPDLFTEDCPTCNQHGDEEYFKNPAISSTDLRVLNTKGINNFRYYKTPEGKEELKEDNDNFRLGSIIHAYILTPNLFNDNYKVISGLVPKSYQAKKFCQLVSTGADIKAAYTSSYKTKANIEKESNEKYIDFKGYIDNLVSYPKATFITRDEYNLARDIKSKHDSLNLLKMFDLGENQDHREIELYWTEDGIECKAKADRLVIDYENKIISLIDYKTTHNSEEEFKDSFLKWGYDFQAIHYISGIIHNLKTKFNIDYEDGWVIHSYILALQKTKPYPVQLYKFNWEKADKTKLLRKELLKKLKLENQETIIELNV